MADAAQEKLSKSNNRIQGEATPPLPATLDKETVVAAEPFVGRWQTLESTTNWEKGRIIAEWRAELQASEAAVTQYSDEAWATLVGNVTSQHVGRLRRVHGRFGEVYQQYDRLYWSHFQAALEWQDAEMWLEGAVQNKWSISQMRAQRWETVGDDAVMPDADAISDGGETPGWSEPSSPQGGSYSTAAPDDANGESVGTSTAAASDASLDASDTDREINASETKPLRPFEDLPELPDDLADAFEQFKLAIVTHRLAGWQEAALNDVLASLEALKRLASAPLEATKD